MTRLHALIAEQLPDEWADLEPGEAAGAGGGRDRDRPRPVGGRAARGRAIRCSRSTRCRWPATASGTPRRGRSPTPATRTCWPRSCAWTAPITARSLATRPRSRRSKLVARTHQSLIWDRTRHLLRLRSVLREYFPAAAAGLRRPGRARTRWSCSAAPGPRPGGPAVPRADHRGAEAATGDVTLEARAEQIQAVLRAPALRQPGAVQAAYAAIVATQVRLIDRAERPDRPSSEAVVGRAFWPAPGR